MSTYVAQRNGGLTNEQGLFEWMQQSFTAGVPGVHNANSLKVVQRGAGANMSVDVSIGDGHFIRPDNAYSYWGWQDAATNVAITTANPSNPRIDVIAAYIDLSVINAGSGGNGNVGALKFMAVAGTPAGSPVAPNAAAVQAAVGASNPFIQLASVTVPAAASSIVTANIADTRAFIASKLRLWGGGANTSGHTVPNIADDTVALLAAVQTLTNKTISGTTNKVRAGGANSSLVDTNSVQIDLETQAKERFFDYVASGCVWTADSPGSTLNASMTSGVIYINGRRLTVAAVSARAFTANKDTYVDLSDNGDGTAAINYDNTTNNNNTSPALAANRLRIAIVQAGASSIAAAGSINQGQEDRTVPVLSNVVATVSDFLGNLICPRTPKPVTIGYAQNQGNQSGITTSTDATGLQVTVITPGNRRIRIKGRVHFANGTAGALNNIRIQEGSTVLDTIQVIAGNTSNAFTAPELEVELTPSAGAHTYKITGSAVSGSLSLFGDAGTVFTKWLRVELD